MGALTAMRDRIQRELRGRLGRTKANFRLWQDTAAIPQGALWEEEIKAAIAQSVFFIPIITPTAVNSGHCKREFELFLAREAELGRRDLIFPLLYIQVPELEDERLWRQHEVLRVIGARQYLDWQERRYLDVNSTEVAVHIGRFCSNIYEALRHPGGTQRLQGRDGVRGHQTTLEAWQDRSPVQEQGIRRYESVDRPLARQQPGYSADSREQGIAGATSGESAASSSRRGAGRKLQFGLAALIGILALAVVGLWYQNSSLRNQAPPPSTSTGVPTTAPAPAPGASVKPSTIPSPSPETTPPPTREREYVIRKGVAFGGNGGAAFDDTAANSRRLPISRIDIGVTLNPANNNQRLIGRLQTQWGDTLGPLHGGGPRQVETSRRSLRTMRSSRKSS